MYAESIDPSALLANNYPPVMAGYPSMTSSPSGKTFNEYTAVGLVTYELAITPNLLVNVTLDFDSKRATIDLRAKDITTLDGINSTRFFFHLLFSPRSFLRLPEIGTVEFKSPSISEEAKRELFYKAKLYRKLHFIENVLGITFNLPTTITSDDAAQIDLIFRGILRGNVYSEVDTITLYKQYPLDMNLKEVDLDWTPQNRMASTNDLKLFGQEVPVGEIQIIMQDAILVNAEDVKQQKKNETGHIPVVFKLINHPLLLHFENFIHQNYKQSLISFHQELSKKEPKEVADLVIEPLTKQISGGEAIEIATDFVLSTIEGKLPDALISPYPAKLVMGGLEWQVDFLIHKKENYDSGIGLSVLIDRDTGKLIDPNSEEEKAHRTQWFKKLSEQWHNDTKYMSSINKKTQHPAYQEIIDMGFMMIPLILEEMKQGKGLWFSALKTISGEDPVPVSSKGNIQQMTQAWLNWGKEKGLIDNVVRS